MQKRSAKGQLVRWRRSAVLVAVGLAVGTMVMATPAPGHVGGTVAHLWGHLRPRTDARYANAVAGTDKARNADKLDGRDSSRFVRGKGRVFRNRIAVSSGASDILVLPDLATVSVLNCRTSVPDANAQIANFQNSQPLDIWRDTGAGDPDYLNPSAGWGWGTPLKESGRTVFEIARGTGADAETATIEIWTHATSSQCVFAVTASLYG